ncbi:hypothetical protein [Streptomyces sp. NPDC004658]|uniref:hypothetical protein n=1 Tax=Streptomyces sp. NPDC004658 TaxID=3154672 RepID=UPI0033B8D085
MKSPPARQRTATACEAGPVPSPRPEQRDASSVPVGEIMLPAGTVVATVVRDGRPTVPHAEVELMLGDELLLVSHKATEQEIHAAFQ